jgi:hypothetical protein
MNSAVERGRKPGPWGFAAAAALLLAGAAFMAGCADHGPTNLYSQTLFGTSQDGAHLEVVRVTEFSLSLTASTDLVGYQVYLKNTGSGGTVGPIHAALGVTSCATVGMATATFGRAKQVINPGDIVSGQAVDSGGNVINSQFAFETTYDLAGCPGATLNYTVTATDPYGSSWNSGFTAISQ